MSRVQERLTAQSDLHEQVAQMIWEAMDPTSIVMEWKDVNDDDRASALQCANNVIRYIQALPCND